MKQISPHVQPRRSFVALVAASALSAFACQGKRPGAGAMTYRMGERATVGRLVYIVTEAEWHTALGDPNSGGRVPENRFLLMRLTITNSGGETLHVPLLSLYTADGRSTLESDNGEQVSGWLGLLRQIKPAETLQGAILFDVKPAAYKLQITNTADAENEIVAYVDIPLDLREDPVLAEPPAINK